MHLCWGDFDNSQFFILESNHPKCTSFSSAPTEILSSREHMLKVTKVDPGIARYIHDSLSNDLDFLTTMLENNILTLPELPDSSIAKFPSLLLSLDNINQYMANENFMHYWLQVRIPEEFWSDRYFVLGWLSAGGDLDNQMPESFVDDTEILYTHAKHYFKKSYCQFDDYLDPWEYPEHLLSDHLCSNIAFTRQLLILGVPPDIALKYSDNRKDYNLVVIAFAKDEDYAGIFDDDSDEKISRRESPRPAAAGGPG